MKTKLNISLGIKIILHFIFWAIPFLLITFALGENTKIWLFTTSNNSLLYATIYGTVFNMIIFYGNCKIILLSNKQVKRTLIVLLSLGLFIIIGPIEGLCDVAYYKFMLRSGIYGTNLKPIDNMWEHIIQYPYYINFIYYTSSFVYAFILLRRRSFLREESLTKEKEIALLNFYKMQISPHFIFNSLNNIYSSVINHKNKEAANAITKLSSLFRYMLYETKTPEVMLHKETAYLKDYIELQRLRFKPDDDISISFEHTGDLFSHKIAPMLLIVLVENAFKHGISLDYKSFVDVKMSVVENELNFTITNSNFSEHTNNLSGGIGLSNLKERLKLLYPDNAELSFSADKHSYTANLKLGL